MSEPLKVSPSQVADILGDLNPFLDAIGSPDGLVALTGAESQLLRVTDIPSLERFLAAYEQQLLAPVEMPAIQEAYQFAFEGKARELIALDQRLAARAVPGVFADASRRAGRQQLRRLRPLRDHRVVQRYLRAVDGGEAAGWHTCVYGLVLAVYSVPMRQGLMHYARHTISSFIDTATARLQLTESASQQLLATVEGRLRLDMETTIQTGGQAVIRAV